MKKYLLFVGAHYYPNGGYEDLAGAFPDIESAEAAFWWSLNETVGRYQLGDAWGQIVDLDTLELVKKLSGESLSFDDKLYGRYSPPEKPKKERATKDEMKSKREQNERLAQAFIDTLTVKPE